MHTTRHLLVATVVAVGSFAFTTPSSAQQNAAQAVHVKGDAKLKAEAKVSEADAIATVRKEVPDGEIEEAELEREDGKLVYSFDIKTPNKSGVEELEIDAMTGAVVKKEYESDKKEKAEKAKEAMEKKTKP